MYENCAEDGGRWNLARQVYTEEECRKLKNYIKNIVGFTTEQPLVIVIIRKPSRDLGESIPKSGILY